MRSFTMGLHKHLQYTVNIFSGVQIDGWQWDCGISCMLAMEIPYSLIKFLKSTTVLISALKYEFISSCQ